MQKITIHIYSKENNIFYEVDKISEAHQLIDELMKNSDQFRSDLRVYSNDHQITEYLNFYISTNT
jgi:hypothetical protein